MLPLSNLFSFVKVNFISHWWSRPCGTRMAQNRSQNLKTVVNNISHRQLTIKDYYIYMREGTDYYGSLGFEIPARERKKIPSGNFIKEYVANKDYQEIHVMIGEEVLHALSHDDFHDNEGKVFLLDMQNDRLHYAFVDPTQDITHTQWICGAPPVREAAP